MRPIDQTIIDELKSDELRTFGLLYMSVDGTEYRYTDADIPLPADGNLYYPRGFDPEVISYGTGQIVDRARFTIDNLDDMFTSAFIGGTPQGASTILSLILLNDNYKVIVNPVTLFEGFIDSWSIQREGEIEIVVASLFARWKQKTLMRQVPSCRWKKFKGPECGYSGDEDWCDRTYSRCQALGNTANFGGQRWLPSIQDKTIWWGRTRG